MFKIGCAEKEFKIPLFVELYGYGPYAGRRNLRTIEKLYCRAFTFFNGSKRAMIVYSDICSTDDVYARELRAKIASKLKMNPESIAFAATHTHSGPSLCYTSPDTSGIRNAEMQEYYKQTVLEVAETAFESEEEIADIDAGAAAPETPLSYNRVDPEKNITDPAIRYMRFKRADGSIKLIIHNHGIHGTSDNGALYKYASSDWMGKVNRFIRERGLAEFSLFLQGPAGDMMPKYDCNKDKDENAAAKLADEYIKVLEKDFANAQTIKSDNISFTLKTVEFPTVKQSAAELRADAAHLRSRGETQAEKDYWAINAARCEEMALLADKGHTFEAFHDLQIINIGEAQFMFVPGELYVESGMELMQNSAAEFPFIATVSNGNGRYLFTKECAERYPSITSAANLYGYYEIYCYMHFHCYKYQNNISDFLIKSFKKLENSQND